MYTELDFVRALEALRLPQWLWKRAMINEMEYLAGDREISIWLSDPRPGYRVIDFYINYGPAGEYEGIEALFTDDNKYHETGDKSTPLPRIQDRQIKSDEDVRWVIWWLLGDFLDGHEPLPDWFIQKYGSE